jgi:hypothetical protein
MKNHDQVKQGDMLHAFKQLLHVNKIVVFFCVPCQLTPQMLDGLDLIFNVMFSVQNIYFW